MITVLLTNLELALLFRFLSTFLQDKEELAGSNLTKKLEPAARRKIDFRNLFNEGHFVT